MTSEKSSVWLIHIIQEPHKGSLEWLVIIADCTA